MRGFLVLYGASTAIFTRTEQIVAKLGRRARAAGATRRGSISRLYRLDRAANEQRAMSYTAARSRLKLNLTDVAAGKGTPGIITQFLAAASRGDRVPKKGSRPRRALAITDLVDDDDVRLTIKR
jgi:hypothetical protein